MESRILLDIQLPRLDLPSKPTKFSNPLTKSFVNQFDSNVLLRLLLWFHLGLMALARLLALCLLLFLTRVSTG